MIQEHKTDDSIAIATKVSRSFYLKLQRICKKKGLKIYNVLQMAAETIVRYVDDRCNLSYDMELMMTIFEHLDGWADAFNMAEPGTDPQVQEAIYFIGDPKCKGMRPVLVEKPYFGQWTETTNVNDILERVFCYSVPNLYKKVRMVGGLMETASIVETIYRLVDNEIREQDLAEMRRGFEDNDRGEWGQKPHEGAPYKRKMHKDVDSQTGLEGSIHFTDEDRQLADEEVTRCNALKTLDDEDWLPFGGEL